MHAHSQLKVDHKHCTPIDAVWFNYKNVPFWRFYKHGSLVHGQQSPEPKILLREQVFSKRKKQAIK
jgi:hypothetical protein